MMSITIKNWHTLVGLPEFYFSNVFFFGGGWGAGGLKDFFLWSTEINPG